MTDSVGQHTFDVVAAILIAIIAVPTAIFVLDRFGKTNCFGVVQNLLGAYSMLRGRYLAWSAVEQQLAIGAGVFLYDAIGSRCFWWNPEPDAALGNRGQAIAGAFMTIPPKECRDLESLAKRYPLALK